jgi:type II secretory pathway component HofQ
MGKNFNFSASVALPTSQIALLPNQDLLNFLAQPFAQTGAILGFRSGGTQTFNINGVSVPVGNVQGLIKAIQSNTQANVLATPQILTLDNSEATFESADKIPVPQTNTIATAGQTTTTFTKESVALSITLKPQINKISNFVRMDITTKLADVANNLVPAQYQGQTFGTTERNAKTSVVVADSDTVVLGGLVRDKSEDNVSKIPILGDIPVLGWLFRAKQSQSTKTNLLVFITPHIIRQYDSIRKILDKKLKERDDFIERNAGGDDAQRYYRDEMIRNLPDIKELTSNAPQKSVTIDEEKPAAVVAPESNPAPQTAPTTRPVPVPAPTSAAPANPLAPSVPAATPTPEPPAPAPAPEPVTPPAPAPTPEAAPAPQTAPLPGQG